MKDIKEWDKVVIDGNEFNLDNYNFKWEDKVYIKEPIRNNVPIGKFRCIKCGKEFEYTYRDLEWFYVGKLTPCDIPPIDKAHKIIVVYCKNCCKPLEVEK